MKSTLGDYHLVAADLRNSSDLGHALLEKGLISPDIPTLFVTECVLQVNPNPKPQTLNALRH